MILESAGTSPILECERGVRDCVLRLKLGPHRESIGLSPNPLFYRNNQESRRRQFQIGNSAIKTFPRKNLSRNTRAFFRPGI